MSAPRRDNLSRLGEATLPRATGLLACLAGVLLLAGCRQAPHRAQEAGPAPPASRATPHDRALTDIARVLAGLPPEDASAFATVTARPAWEAYRAAMDAHWAKEREGRFTAITAWRDHSIAEQVAGCRVLLYPFGGPDILHAYLFFPRCDTYVLFGLEHLGSVPQVGRLPAARVDRLVGDLRSALADLFTRHYFITKDMMADLRESDLDGITPLLLMLLARLEARIVRADRVTLTPTGEAVPVVDDRPPGGGQGAPPARGNEALLVASRVVFVTEGHDRPQQVIYFRAQAENGGLARHPGVEAYLRHLAPVTTFLKSASYLLHTEPFSTMRTIILDDSSVILQDDSGVPYRFLSAPSWRVTLFGRYARPIADFNYGFQRDLDAAYAAAGSVPVLPFSFGYHWRDGSWGVMLAVRGGGRRESP